MCALLANVLGVEAPGSLEAGDLIISRVSNAITLHNFLHCIENIRRVYISAIMIEYIKVQSTSSILNTAYLNLSLC